MYEKSILSEKVAGDIRQMIMDRELVPGDKLPNELILTKELNVSRSTVREAIKILRTANVLEVQRGRGTFVSENPGLSKDPLGVTFMEEGDLLKHFFEVRLMLEPLIAEVATTRCTDQEIDEIKEAYTEVKNMIQDGKDHTEADIHFHNIIAASTHNPIMQRLIPIINEGIKGGSENARSQAESQEEVIEQHREIMRAITERDSLRAKEAMKHHIEYGMSLVK